MAAESETVGKSILGGWECRLCPLCVWVCVVRWRYVNVYTPGDIQSEVGEVKRTELILPMEKLGEAWS